MTPLKPMSEIDRVWALAVLGLDADLLPLDSTPAELLAAHSPIPPFHFEVDMSDPVIPSPTGTPVMPNWIAPVSAALGSVALAVTQIAPNYTIAFKLATLVLGLCSIFGPVSAGWRK